MVSTLDSESSDPSSNLGGTFNIFYILKILNNKLIIFNSKNFYILLVQQVSQKSYSFWSSHC